MAQHFVSLPEKLPTPEKAVNTFVNGFLNKPCGLLGNLAPVALLQSTATGAPVIDVMRAWFVGSRVWTPALLSELAPDDKDIDIVFRDKGCAKEFVEHVKAVLSERNPGKAKLYSITEEGRLHMRRHKKPIHVFKLIQEVTDVLDRKLLMDIMSAWDIPGGPTIAEHIMGFQYPHERCAILAGVGLDDGNALTRVVRPEEYSRPPDDDHYGS